MNDLAIADAIQTGLPVNAFEALVSFLKSIDASAMYKVISELTYRRAKATKAHLSRDASERVYDVARVLDEVLGAYHGDLDRALEFLRMRNQLLKGRTPFDVASSSTAGANAVVSLVRRAKADVAI